MSTGGIKVVVGGATFENKEDWTQENVETFLRIIDNEGVREIDTAQYYGDSELVLGQVHAGEQFDIATKVPGAMAPGSLHKDEIVKRTAVSLERLKMKPVDILYLHAPDITVPIEETLEGIQEAYSKGMFRRFGISNYAAADVQKIYENQRSKGWVLPTVYQGNYNPVTRHCEKDLFPTLIRLQISFYAYGPSAGGFLAKTKQDILDGVGRFSKDGGLLSTIHHGLYNKPTLLDALTVWGDIARDAATTPYNLAVRWVTYNSSLKPERGDAVVVGSTKIKYLEGVFVGLREGPLSPEIVSRIDDIWRRVRDERHTDMVEFYNSYRDKI